MSEPEPRITATSSSVNGVHPEPARRDDDVALACIDRIKKQFQKMALCGQWNADNERIAREQFRQGVPIEMLENAMIWGCMMRLKSAVNNGNSAKIASLQYFVNSMADEGFQQTSAEQIRHFAIRLERELAKG